MDSHFFHHCRSLGRKLRRGATANVCIFEIRSRCQTICTLSLSKSDAVSVARIVSGAVLISECRILARPNQWSPAPLAPSVRPLGGYGPTAECGSIQFFVSCKILPRTLFCSPLVQAPWAGPWEFQLNEDKDQVETAPRHLIVMS
jgi:hypothetical protein